MNQSEVMTIHRYPHAVTFSTQRKRKETEEIEGMNGQRFLLQAYGQSTLKERQQISNSNVLQHRIVTVRPIHAFQWAG